MFEGKSIVPGDSAADALRPLAWSDLAARLAATRDLRASLAVGEKGGEASFDAMSARWIAAHASGQEGINPEVSANGKGTGPKGAEVLPASRGGAVRDQ
jgi:hypothetical protein